MNIYNFTFRVSALIVQLHSLLFIQVLALMYFASVILHSYGSAQGLS